MIPSAVIELQLLPPISWFASLIHHGHFFLERQENFQKSSYRNRYHISGPNGLLKLSVPLKHGKDQRSIITDVAISYSEDWRKQHWNSLQASYRRSPYFEYYEDHFSPFFEKRFSLLWELNTAMLEMVLDLLQIKIPIDYTAKYHKNPDDCEDLRNRIHPRRSVYDPPGWFQCAHYHQVFEDRNGFIPDLSIVDLLFNEGPHSAEVLEKCIVLQKTEK